MIVATGTGRWYPAAMNRNRRDIGFLRMSAMFAPKESEMLVVNIELVPGGDPSRRRTIASLHIANQSDLADLSSYWVDAVEAANPVSGTPSRMASFRVENHLRAQSVWKLIQRALSTLETAAFVEL